jgi:D-alanyl-lipoteichoic acid acyltransferase DltB (MBOAT superfamily)
LTSGPIEPARRFLPQMSKPKEYDPHVLRSGILQIGMGLFKKVVVADRLALIVDAVFDQPGMYHGLTVITAIAFYSFQIYFDFSGYTDIALGIARMFGYHLSPNFKKPFLAENINEFWNRWHITFTGWLREYIFFPLRRSLLRSRSSSKQFLALFIPPLATMLASGLWHGFQSTYLVWGLYHGLLLYANTAYTKKKNSSSTHSPWFGRIFTFALVTFGFLFFRSASLPDTVILLQSIFVKSTTYHDLLLNIHPMDLILSFTAIILIMGFETYLHDRHKSWNDLSFGVQWALVLMLLLSISIVGVYQPINTEFIYAAF